MPHTVNDRIATAWQRWLRHGRKRYRLGNPYAPPCAYVAELQRRENRAQARHVRLQRKAERAASRLPPSVHVWRMCRSCHRANYCLGCHECQCGYKGEP